MSVQDANESNEGVWLYAWGQSELATLYELVHDGFAMGRNVDYAPTAARLSNRVDFRAGAGIPAAATGQVHVHTVGGRRIHAPAALNGRIVLPVPIEDIAMFSVWNVEGGPAALFLEHADEGWEARLPWKSWHPATAVTGRPGSAPHRLPEPTVTLHPVEVDGVWELPYPVLGRVLVESDVEPVVTTGESREEANADPHHLEMRYDLDELSPGVWQTRHVLGFRYLTVRGAAAHTPRVHAIEPPPVRGAFRCSDPRLTTIWETAARTLTTSTYGLVVDGLKRDRMPWMGDLALALHANAYVTGDIQPIRRGLLALGQLDHGYINGIADYTLWWFIAVNGYLAQTGDRDFAVEVAEWVERNANDLAELTDQDGLLHPIDLDDTFIAVFIDWGVSMEPGRTQTSLQLLWLWALRSITQILSLAQRPAAHWATLADDVASQVVARAWDDDAGVWLTHLDDPASPAGAHAAVFGVLAGALEGSPAGVRDLLTEHAPIGTPFMSTFALQALARTGGTQEALDVVRTAWGGMIDLGAVTFWEEFPDETESPWEMYGRPFGKSLCHAWSSGPAFLLPELVFGIQQLRPGWAEFAITPRLESLTWATVEIPTTRGAITIGVTPQEIAMTLPAGTIAIVNERPYTGPLDVKIPLDQVASTSESPRILASGLSDEASQ